MLRKTRSEIMDDFKAQVAQGKILVGVGAGTGITAKGSEKADVDMLIIYNSGRFRMAGRGSLSGLLSYGDANAIVQEMGQEVLPIVKKTPVLAGVCGTDPVRVMDIFLKQLKDQGFNGVQNFPTVGLNDGKFRANLEETGMGYGLEVDMIREAHKLDLLTCPYVFDPEQAKEYYDKAVEELGSAPSEVTLLVADDSVSKSVATFIQSELVTTLGLNVVIDTKTVQGRGELMDANNYQFAVTAWGADYDAAMTFLDLWTNGTPYRGNYNDADYNALISDAKTQTDDAARLDDMLKAEKKLVEEDAVVAPVYHRGSAVLTKSNVKNLISHPIGVPLEFKYASFE